jgi:SAM-dependent methyltransferase
VADVGSGVTFFPFAIARLGFTVICVDLDPTYAVDIERAAASVSQGAGKVAFEPTDGRTLPFATGSVDVVCCVSVIEHVPRHHQFLLEIHRVLVPGGTFVYTCDLDLRGDAEIGVHEFTEVRTIISSLFDTVAEERTIHPADILTTRNSPYPLRTSLKSLPRRAASMLLTPLLKGERRFMSAVQLAVYGGVGTKR